MKKTSTTNLLEYFDNQFTLEELIYAIELLENETHISEVYRICGTNLNGITNKTYTQEEKNHYDITVLPLIKKILKKLYPEKKIKHKQKEKTLIVEESNPVIEPKIIEKEKIIEPKEILTKEEYEFIKTIFNSPEIKELTKLQLSIEEILIASLLHGFAYGKSLTIEQISIFLNIDKEIVKEIALKTIQLYNEEINKQIDLYILKLRSE